MRPFTSLRACESYLQGHYGFTNWWTWLHDQGYDLDCFQASAVAPSVRLRRSEIARLNNLTLTGMSPETWILQELESKKLIREWKPNTPTRVIKLWSGNYVLRKMGLFEATALSREKLPESTMEADIELG